MLSWCLFWIRAIWDAMGRTNIVLRRFLFRRSLEELAGTAPHKHIQERSIPFILAYYFCVFLFILCKLFIMVVFIIQLKIIKYPLILLLLMIL
jgi:hypothetical protein